MKLTFFILIANAFAKVKLFHENCTPCERFHTCTDIAAQVYRNLALHKEEEELIQGTFNNTENCIKGRCIKSLRLTQ